MGLAIRPVREGAAHPGDAPSLSAQVVKKNCCGSAGAGCGYGHELGILAGTLRSLLLAMPKEFTASPTPNISKASAARSKTSFISTPRLFKSAVERASS